MEDDQQEHNNSTIEQDLLRLERDEIEEHALLDERWDGEDEPGAAKLQRRSRHLFAILAGSEAAGERLLRDTPASNMILLRKKNENEALLKSQGNLERFWRFHRAVIAAKKPKVVLTYAVTYTRKIAEMLDLGEAKKRDSGHPRALPYLYAWQLHEGPMLLAIPSLSQYDPGGVREQALKSFFDEFVPKAR